MNATRWHSLRAPPASAIGRTPPVADEIWEEAARHYYEPALAALIIEIALIKPGTASPPSPGSRRALAPACRRE